MVLGLETCVGEQKRAVRVQPGRARGGNAVRREAPSGAAGRQSCPHVTSESPSTKSRPIPSGSTRAIEAAAGGAVRGTAASQGRGSRPEEARVHCAVAAHGRRSAREARRCGVRGENLRGGAGVRRGKGTHKALGAGAP